jgi:hypothetical protein
MTDVMEMGYNQAQTKELQETIPRQVQAAKDALAPWCNLR